MESPNSITTMPFLLGMISEKLAGIGKKLYLCSVFL